MRVRRWLGTLALCLGLLWPGAARALDDEEWTLLFELIVALEPGGTLEIPELGIELSADTQLGRDWNLPPDVVWKPGELDYSYIPAPTPLWEIGDNIGVLEALSDEDREGLLSSFAPPPPSDVPPDPTYTVVIEAVDTRDFPMISVQMRIFPKDISTPAFSPAGLAAYGVTIEETVLGELREVTDFDDTPPITICESSTVVIGLAMDTSCSVTSVLDGMKLKAVEFFERVLDPARAKSPEDSVALFTFDGKGVFREPTVGSNPLFASAVVSPPGFIDQVRDIEVGPPCGGSPIFQNMERELLRVANYRSDDNDIRRALVTFADFRDTEAAAEEASMIQVANANDVTLINLGFGNVNLNRVTNVSESTGGSFIQNASDNALEALEMVYDGLAYKYCLRYRTPFPNRVNEVSNVRVTLADGSTGAARYPLPFVIPEDSPAPALFMPVSQYQYDRLTAAGAPTTRIELDLVDAPPGPERPVGLNFNAPADAWVNDPDLGPGFFVDGSTLTNDAKRQKWEEIIRVPTAYLDRDPASEEDPAIQSVSHWEADIHFRSGASAGAGKPYLSTPLISVQDRTPPHVFLELKPADGGAVYRLRLYEDPMDVNPHPLVEDADFAGGRISSTLVEPAGFGQKRGRIAYEWRVGGGFPFEGAVGGQLWAGPEDGDGVAEAVLTDPDNGIFDDETGGITIPAGMRVLMEIRARDNFAALERSTATDDQAAFAQQSADPAVGPMHAQFDLNRPEAQTGDLAPPFLALVPRATLRANPRVEGVSWWIESEIEGDRNANYDGIPEFVYTVDDETERANGVGTAGEPLRKLHVRAQDGSGNVSRVSIPIFVTGKTFEATRLETQTARAGRR